ncbi:MAG: hypothetical protein IJX55_05125, partial [Clostridia bacterium]|nr:hypothetical protein [Clostridia bacterium]
GVLSVAAHGKSYAIKLLGAKKIILNLYFLFSKNKYFKKYLNRIFRRFAFAVENGEMKIFVLIPIFGKAQTGRFIENGERIDEYRIFYGTPFLRAMENDFLER